MKKQHNLLEELNTYLSNAITKNNIKEVIYQSNFLYHGNLRNNSSMMFNAKDITEIVSLFENYVNLVNDTAFEDDITALLNSINNKATTAKKAIKDYPLAITENSLVASRILKGNTNLILTMDTHNDTMYISFISKVV